MSNILNKLCGGDLRSIGRANEVAKEVEDNLALFKDVFSGLCDEEAVVRMRSADVIEKVTKNKPDLLSGYKSKVISLLATSEQQELCWHLAQIAPRLEYDFQEENDIVESLKRYLLHKSKIVRVSAMESLTSIAERNTSLLGEINKIIESQMATGSPAVQSRGRKLLQRLERMKKNDKI